MSGINDYFALNSRLYIEAVDKFDDHIALLEQLRGIANEVNEEDMKIFIEHEPAGGLATWFSFEPYYHREDAPERPFSHFFIKRVKEARIRMKKIVIPPDIGCAV